MMICLLRLVFIYSTIDARLVDFQLPVGPVMSMKPFEALHIFFTDSQSQSSSSVGMLCGIHLKAIEYPFEST